MAKVIIYHNTRCSKSRQTLAMLEDKGLDIEVIEYLKTPPDSTALKSILQALDISARELMRTKEAVYTELKLEDSSLSEDGLIQAMIENPILIERPIVSYRGKCAIGRPPENVLKIL